MTTMPDSFDRGWNAAIDELERQDGFGEWAEAAEFMRQLKKEPAMIDKEATMEGVGG
jgi:hypothetical protein